MQSVLLLSTCIRLSLTLTLSFDSKTKRDTNHKQQPIPKCLLSIYCHLYIYIYLRNSVQKFMHENRSLWIFFVLFCFLFVYFSKIQNQKWLRPFKQTKSRKFLKHWLHFLHIKSKRKAVLGRSNVVFFCFRINNKRNPIRSNYCSDRFVIKLKANFNCGIFPVSFGKSNFSYWNDEFEMFIKLPHATISRFTK